MTHPGFDIGPTLGGRFELDFIAGLIAGFSTSVHCLAMCGGIAAAIAVRSVAPSNPARSGAVLGMVSYGLIAKAQMGRVAVYILLGSVAGALGAGFHQSRPPELVHEIAQIAGAVVLATAAFSVLGVAMFDGRLGQIGARVFSPITRRLHHLHRIGPFGLGLAWGLMPCALVYLTTFYAGLTGSAIQGGLVMAGFGLGTVPIMMAMSLGAAGLSDLARNIWIKLVSASALMALAIYSLL